MRWYFCHGTKFEDFTPLYNDGKYILVRNDATKEYSFGLTRDFGTLCGFPVNQSCLTLEELQAVLNAFIAIDAKYNDVCNTSKIYMAMKNAVIDA